MRKVLKFVSGGPITIKTCEGVKPYPVRRIRVKGYGRFEFDEFIGTVSCEDALLDLHEGDVLLGNMSFFVYKHKGRLLQRVSLSNLVKMKEVD